MTATMSKKKAPKVDPPPATPKPAPKSAKKPRGPILHMRVPVEVEAALLAYIAAQDAPPDRTAVGLAALRAFLAVRGFLKPPRPA